MYLRVSDTVLQTINNLSSALNRRRYGDADRLATQLSPDRNSPDRRPRRDSFQDDIERGVERLSRHVPPDVDRSFKAKPASQIPSMDEDPDIPDPGSLMFVFPDPHSTLDDADQPQPFSGQHPHRARTSARKRLQERSAAMRTPDQPSRGRPASNVSARSVRSSSTSRLPHTPRSVPRSWEAGLRSPPVVQGGRVVTPERGSRPQSPVNQLNGSRDFGVMSTPGRNMRGRRNDGSGDTPSRTPRSSSVDRGGWLRDRIAAQQQRQQPQRTPVRRARSRAPVFS